jgi:hypothetical protein
MSNDIPISVDEEVVVIAPRKRKQRSGEDVAPPTDGDLTITVHIISVNAASTKKNITFTVKNAGEALQNVDHYNAIKNLALPTVSAQAVHEMVINYLGGVARENREKFALRTSLAF